MESLEDVRRRWMLAMGFSDDEIEDSITYSPPVDMQDELEDCKASLQLRDINRSTDRQKISGK